MPVGAPNFSPFPFERLPSRSRSHAAIESVLARWVAVRSELPSVAKLVGGPTVATSVGIATRAFDPYAAFAEVRIGSLAIVVGVSGHAIRAIAQRLLGGPGELPAPRPATAAEHAIWVLLLAAALNDLGVDGDAWPLADAARTALERDLVERGRPTSQLVAPKHRPVVKGDLDDRDTQPRPAVRLEDLEPPPRVVPISVGDREVTPIEIVVDAAGTPMVVVAWCPVDVVFRLPPPRRVHGWTFELPIVVARCMLDRAAVKRLAVRDVIVVERELSLALCEGAIGLHAVPGSVEAKVATGYVPRDMADDAQLDLTVRLGTTKLGLRRIGELAVGEVIALGRPLAGPYEIHVAGRQIGEGELVDIDGEVGVRIVSLIEE